MFLELLRGCGHGILLLALVLPGDSCHIQVLMFGEVRVLSCGPKLSREEAASKEGFLASLDLTVARLGGGTEVLGAVQGGPVNLLHQGQHLLLDNKHGASHFDELLPGAGPLASSDPTLGHQNFQPRPLLLE